MNTQIGTYLYRAGVPSQDFEFYAAPQIIGRQRQSMWCWAASIQMILNYHGLFVNQEQIVQKVFGSPFNTPAYLQHILYALSGWAPDTRGRISTIHASKYLLSTNQIIADLSSNWPLLVGFHGRPIGHACVLTAVEYLQFTKGFPIITKAIYRDPWPGNFSKQEITWAIFRLKTSFLVRVWVSRL